MLSDTLPPGMVLTGPPIPSLAAGTTTALSCSGAAGASAFQCSFGTMSIAAAVDVLVPVRVTAATASPQSIVNTATATTASIDPNPANNSASAAITVNASSLAGRVFRNFADNGAFDGNDSGIAGVLITLTGTDLNGTPVSRTTTTDANGDYVFDLLPQGRYRITQDPLSEPELAQRPARPGSSGGISGGPTVISTVDLPPLTDATGYLFPKMPQSRLGLAKAVVGAPDIGADGTFE